MNQKQADKQFALIVEDFYEDADGTYPTVGAYPISRKSQTDVFCRKLALIVVVAMAAMVVLTYVIQNPITIPIAFVIAVTFIVYRNMVKDYEKKNA
jgi:hypothetical protein